MYDIRKYIKGRHRLMWLLSYFVLVRYCILFSLRKALDDYVQLY